MCRRSLSWWLCPPICDSICRAFLVADCRHLRPKFRIISVAGHPRDKDPIRDELKQLSDEWWPLEAADVVSTTARIREQSPSLLLDLGGHSADNHPRLLTQRIASVQATYLGFYGPTYATCCDWWIVDHALMSWIEYFYQVLKRSGLCQVPVFVISQASGCPILRPSHTRNPNTRFTAVSITRKITVPPIGGASCQS